MIAFAEISGLQFGQPWWLAVGLVVCVSIALFYRKFDRRRQSDLEKMAHARFLPLLFAGDSPQRRRLKRVLWIAAVGLCFTSLARPQMGYEFREVRRRGIDLLFALDTSQSMLADDLSPNRLDRARLGIHDFVGRLEGDRIGLIPFAGSAYALCPLTLDYDAFRESLQVINTQMIPHQGTDLASAIQEAERLFEENQNNQRILVLITDGEDLQGDVLEVAKKAHEKGMVIYTVGVGNPEGSTIPIQYQNGRRDVMRDQKGEVVRTKLDESTLKKIAEMTKGLYVPLGRGAEGLNTIYQEKLRLMPKTDLNQRMEKIPLEQFVWPLALAVLLLFVEFFLPDRKRVKPVPAALMGWLLIFLGTAAVIQPLSGQGTVTYNRGTEAYQRGEFAEASDLLRESLHTADLELQQRTYYNLGNALYRLGQQAQEKEPDATIKRWQDSIKAYEDALALRSDDDDARYNRDLVKKKLEQLQQQQQQQNPQDQKNKDQQEQEKKEQEQKEKEKQEQEQKESQEQKGEEQKQDPKEGKEEEGKEKGEEEKGESKEEKGEPKESQEAQQKPADKEGEEQGQQAGQRAQAREMTAEEAKQLLESLRHEERRVIPIPQRRDGKTDNTTKGKTW
jgi:Ca-activated chloride channel family protein